MTAEQLEELQRLIKRAKDFADQAKGYDAPLFEAELLKMADNMDALARRVIAAEKLVEAVNGVRHYIDGYAGSDEQEALDKALTAYREASK